MGGERGYIPRPLISKDHRVPASTSCHFPSLRGSEGRREEGKVGRPCPAQAAQLLRPLRENPS